MIRLVPAIPSDSWLFWELRRQVEPGLSHKEHEQWWGRVFEHRWVAYDGPVLVGIVRITHEGVLSIIVAKSEQRKGFGSEILRRIKPVAHEAGFVRLRAEVDINNVASQAAFNKAGWVPTRVEVEV